MNNQMIFYKLIVRKITNVLLRLQIIVLILMGNKKTKYDLSLSELEFHIIEATYSHATYDVFGCHSRFGPAPEHRRAEENRLKEQMILLKKEYHQRTGHRCEVDRRSHTLVHV